MRNKAVFILSIALLFFSGCSPLAPVEKLSRNIDTLYAKVEQIYSRLIDRKPADEGVRLSLGRFYYKNRDYTKARDALLPLFSEESRLLLAKTYARLKDFTSALEIFQRFKDIDDAEALFLFGISLEAKNLFPQAKTVYKSIGQEPYKQMAGEKLDSLKIRFDQKVPFYIKERMASCPGLEKFPNASSIIVFCDEQVRLTEDNKSVATIHVLVKVLNDKGRKDWGEVEIGYDSTYEKVDLDFARTITPDGRVISVGKENIRDVSKYLNFPLYSNSRAYIISMPEVLKDSFIEYKVTIRRSKLINEKDVSFIYRLKESQPVLDCSLKLVAPEDKDIFFHKLNTGYLPGHLSLDPKKEKSQGQKSYTFVFKDIPQFIPEAHMIDPSFTNPALVISSFSDWQEFYEWWTRLYKDKLKATPRLKEFLNDLLEGAGSEHEKARRIHEFCAEKIRYVAIEYGEAGFEPHFAEEVLLNKYGD
jgi:tetratricopeptide (TPR) repeat protein